MVLCPSELSKLQFSTRHQTLFSFIPSHGESDRLGTVVAAPTPLSFLWSSVMVCVKIGVVVVSFWECSCPAFGYGLLMSLDLSIEYHYCTWVVWYWKPPWSCIGQTMEIRLSQSSLRHTHSSCNGENVMIMLAVSHRVVVYWRPLAVVIDVLSLTETRSPQMFFQQNKLKIWLYPLQIKRISTSWIVTTKHVIFCSESVWDGWRCNIWIH